MKQGMLVVEQASLLHSSSQGAHGHQPSLVSNDHSKAEPAPALNSAVYRNLQIGRWPSQQRAKKSHKICSSTGTHKMPALIYDGPGRVVVALVVRQQHGEDGLPRHKSPRLELQEAAPIATGALRSHCQHGVPCIPGPAAARDRPLQRQNCTTQAHSDNGSKCCPTFMFCPWPALLMSSTCSWFVSLCDAQCGVRLALCMPQVLSVRHNMCS